MQIIDSNATAGSVEYDFGGDLFDIFIVPCSQELDPSTNPSRFNGVKDSAMPVLGQCVALLESLQNQRSNPVHVLPLQIPLSVCAFALRAVRRCTR